MNNWSTILNNAKTSADIVAILRNVLAQLDSKSFTQIEELFQQTDLTAQQKLDALQIILNTTQAAANVEVGNLKNAIQTALAASVGATGWTTQLVSYLPPFVGAYARNQRVKNAESLSVLDFGAIGDGTMRPLSQRYATLALAQVDYPFVTSLSQSIDWAAAQAAANTGIKVFFPAGKYMHSDVVKTKHSTSPYSFDSGQYFHGEGIKTIVTRGNTTDIASTDDVICSTQAVFATHGSNNQFELMRLEDAAVGIYLGQDYSQVANSSCSHNTYRKLFIRNCGTGIISACAQGNHYNEFSGIHFAQNQIDMHLKNGNRWTGSSNNNRNTFFKIRSARSWVGLWIESGDTNFINAWHGETCKTNPQSNRYLAPTGLPGGLTTCVHIIGGQLNRFTGCQMEDCEVELYNYGYDNSYISNGYHEAVANGTQVILAQPAGMFISPKTFVTGGFAKIFNNNTLAFPGLLPGAPTFTGKTLKCWNEEVEQKNPDHVLGTYKKEVLYELGAQIASATVPITIWLDGDSKSAALIKVRVASQSLDSVLSFTAEFTINAYRSSTKGLSRYYLFNNMSTVSTGVGAGSSTDTTKLIGGALSSGGTSTRDLILTLTLPNYAMSAISVHTERLVTKSA